LKGDPAYLGGGQPPEWRKLVGCAIVTLVVLVIAVVLIYILPAFLVCGDPSGCRPR
jgi:hypothetical protein